MIYQTRDRVVDALSLAMVFAVAGGLLIGAWRIWKRKGLPEGGSGK